MGAGDRPAKHLVSLEVSGEQKAVASHLASLRGYVGDVLALATRPALLVSGVGVLLSEDAMLLGVVNEIRLYP
jgi:hypothetical protein